MQGLDLSNSSTSAKKTATIFHRKLSTLIYILFVQQPNRQENDKTQSTHVLIAAQSVTEELHGRGLLILLSAI
jgi:hypothetical protein